MVLMTRLFLWGKFTYLAFCLMVHVPLFVVAQDTLGIADVHIVARKSGFASLGKKTEPVDSAVLEQFRFGNVAEVLGFNSAAHIKTYGSGAIATTALRGASAEQTAILWNGMNLQNSMLGLSDLSLLPAVLFDQVSVEYGGSSSLWGSGAMAGSVHLGNRSVFGKGLKVTTGIAGGSFGQLNGSAIIRAGNNRLVNTTRLYTAGSSNNFQYHRLSDAAVVTMSNAAFWGRGIMNEFKAALGNHQILTLNIWLGDNNRQVPTYHNGPPSKLFQDDNSTRILGSWSHSKNDFRSQLRSAYFNERIRFTDSLRSQFTDSRVQTSLTDNENFWSWGQGHEFYLGFSHLLSVANSHNYEDTKSLRRISLLAGNKFSFLSGKLSAAINTRAEYFSAGTLPVTGNLAFEYRPKKFLSAGLNLSKIYRQPTLNELYWMPGGNPSLEAEQGEAVDAVLAIEKNRARTGFKFSVAGFSRNIHNWILWVPGIGAQPTPMNVQEVWSRGLETVWKSNFRNDNFNGGFQLISAYVLSTVEHSRSENSASTGKQLMYTPRYSVNGSVNGGYRQSQLFCFVQYAGYRFTTSDNTEWLDPYTTISLRFTQSVVTRGQSLVFFAACNNLLNSNYMVLAGRPMPLRNFEIGLTIHFKNIKQINDDK